MKTTLKFIIAAVAAMIIGVSASAQVHFGLVGGVTSSSADADAKVGNMALYHVGFVTKIPMGLGFAFQPGITYQMKGASLSEITGDVSTAHFDTKVGYLEFPFQFQWGPDLVLFRPYALAEPFIGIGLNVQNDYESLRSKSFDESAMNRFEYGLALGGGVEIWKFQLSAKYFWNFGSLRSGIKDGDIASTVSSAFKDGKSFNGFTFSLAFLF
ncbi:MAG: PorT family protein [Bacteroidales bacterium]|nr:PorT family protein [Bacteroidales bacterium]MBQ9712999.1 PorT family protein [Bacteroidales bacterium]MBR1433564.1 PorT family protein [Bacteroidales bacterium]